MPLPAGYVLSARRIGDTASWVDVLQEGEFGRWDEERILEDAERREGSRTVEHNGRIVAVTFASRIGNQPRKPSVGGINIVNPSQAKTVPRGSFAISGGADGIRTRDFLLAKQALSH